MSDNSFKMMIGLASAGARGDSFSSKDIDWQKMLQLAVEHNVIPLVAWLFFDIRTYRSGYIFGTAHGKALH